MGTTILAVAGGIQLFGPNSLMFSTKSLPLVTTSPTSPMYL